VDYDAPSFREVLDCTRWIWRTRADYSM